VGDIDRQNGDLISLLSFLESRLKINHVFGTDTQVRLRRSAVDKNKETSQGLPTHSLISTGKA
jgi:hypothetical protein